MCETWGRVHMRTYLHHIDPDMDRHQHGNSDPDPDRHQNDAGSQL
jgi:hypothetical protein